jgi:hypothetical protein
LLCEQLEQWVERLSGEGPVEPEVIKELAIRLLALAGILLRQHAVSKRGRCRFCSWTRWNWGFWRRWPRCSVHGALDFAMMQGLGVVWWRLLESAGRNVSVEEARGWVEARMPADDDEQTEVVGAGTVWLPLLAFTRPVVELAAFFLDARDLVQGDRQVAQRGGRVWMASL